MISRDWISCLGRISDVKYAFHYLMSNGCRAYEGFIDDIFLSEFGPLSIK